MTLGQVERVVRLILSFILRSVLTPTANFGLSGASYLVSLLLTFWFPLEWIPWQTPPP